MKSICVAFVSHMLGLGVMTKKELSARNVKLIEEIAERTSAIEKGVDNLVNARKLANKIDDEHPKALPITTRLNPNSTAFATRLTNWS